MAEIHSDGRRCPSSSAEGKGAHDILREMQRGLGKSARAEFAQSTLQGTKVPKIDHKGRICPKSMIMDEVVQYRVSWANGPRFGEEGGG